MSMLFFNTPNSSLFFGFCVEINGIILLLSFCVDFESNSCLGMESAFLIPVFIIDCGYFL